MRRKMIKVQTFPGATISDMKIFTVPLLKERLDKVIVAVGTTDALYYTLDEIFKDMKEVRLLIQKMIPSTKTTI